MNITVYLGANPGRSPVYGETAAELGRLIGRRGDTLIYGGSRTGLMGKLADGALEEGAQVIGVEPEMFVRREYQHEGISRLIVTDDMTQRKQKMQELGDAFIAFPGGTGTLEEISEIMSACALGMWSKPCIFFNLNGYYEEMKGLLEKMKREGFSDERRQKRIYFAGSLEEIGKIIDEYR